MSAPRIALESQRFCYNLSTMSKNFLRALIEALVNAFLCEAALSCAKAEWLSMLALNDVLADLHRVAGLHARGNEKLKQMALSLATALMTKLIYHPPI